MPEVARTWTLESFIPGDQEQKLPVIDAADKALAPTLRITPGPAASDAENVAALKQGVRTLQEIDAQHTGIGADAPRRLTLR